MRLLVDNTVFAHAITHETPEQLGKFLGLLPVNPVLLSYSDASFPVRPDLHWPDEQRNPPRLNDSK